MSRISVKVAGKGEVELAQGATGLDLQKKLETFDAFALLSSGVLRDLRDPLDDGADVEFVTKSSVHSLEVLRHSAEHLLAAAVIELFPGAQVTMGPKSHSSEFYYDFDIGRPFTPEDLERIEAGMQALIDKRVPFSKSILPKEEARSLFKKLGQRFKDEILDWIPDDKVSVYQCADFIDLCRGPHVLHAGWVKAFKLLGVSGSYWRADASREPLQRIYGIAFASKEELKAYLERQEEAKKRDHRKLGRELELFFVSERSDSHDYPELLDIDMLVTGTMRADMLSAGPDALKILSDADFMGELTRCFAPKNVKPSAVSLNAHDISDTRAFALQIKLRTPHVSEEQRRTLKEISANLQKKYPDGSIELSVETRFVEEIGAGLVTWLPKGAFIRQRIETLIKDMCYEGGYEFVCSPHIAKSDLWKVSGHWFFYKDSMFSPMVVDGQEYVLKPMNCPFHVEAFKNRKKSYRDLPRRYAEFGTVYRYELAGVMHGLMRVRGFTQDDAHIFCRPDQVDAEIDSIMELILRVFNTFGFSEFEVQLATRPEKYVGDPAIWERAEKSLLDAVIRRGLPYRIDVGGGAFYGPKIDIKLKDCLDRLWQCSTVQLDFNLPERFALEYINEEGKAAQPFMIHRAILGSVERFIGILTEHYAGAFPMWICSEQVRILTVADRHLSAAETLVKALRAQGIRAEIGPGSEKLGAKIRAAQLDKVPAMLVIGEKEAQDGGASVRLRSGEDLGFMEQSSLLAYLKDQAKIPHYPVA
jgi:threonyl-tRNA synthetase